MRSLLLQFVRRANLPFAVTDGHAFAPDFGGHDGRVLHDATLEQIERLRRAGFAVVRLRPQADGRFSAVLVADVGGGYRVGATTYELDRLASDPGKRITSIAAHGLGRWIVAWLDRN